MDQIEVFCPGSVANISCGFDVLGFCLEPVGDLMKVTKTDKPGITIGSIKGQDLPKDPLKNVASVAAMALLEAHPSSFGFQIDIDKRIKPGSGIGSSAASAAGAVFAINELLGKPYSRNELVQYAMAGEALASGAAHADNLAPVLLGGFTLVRSNQSLDIIKLPSPPELVATVIHPKIELKTIHSRAILKNTVPLDKAIQQWGNLGAFVSALYTNDYDLLSRSMKDKVIEPYRAMLIPRFHEVKAAALHAGALGSGISGSGPSIYALSKGMDIAKQVGEAMKKQFDDLELEYEVHLSKINNEGIKIV
ncbi:homoserine kinase [Flavobacteriaceae bacterium]|jgi:homoserine kinase|nr:homoserine kinase [Flavobacteriaceae bacterium]MDC1056847.1 homoserine kinase [Flavobacteriaceae bacterium]